MSNVTDVSLLERVRKTGDEAAWGAFAQVYTPLIETWLRAKGMTSGFAADVRQEVLLVVLRELPGFEHNRRTGAFRNWLRQVTANQLRAFWRKENRAAQARGPEFLALAEQLEDHDSELSREFNLQHDRYVLEKLLELIEAQFQRNSVSAFREVVLKGRDASEVAESLGMTVNAVRIAQSRVLRKLREFGRGLLD